MRYFLNTNQQSSGDFEVHDVNCSWGLLVESYNREELGDYFYCSSAVNEAKRRHPQHAHQINGCYHCSWPCHTT